MKFVYLVQLGTPASYGGGKKKCTNVLYFMVRWNATLETDLTFKISLCCKGRICCRHKNTWYMHLEEVVHSSSKHPWQLIMESCWQWLERQMLTCAPTVCSLGLMTRWEEGQAISEWGQLAAGTLLGKGKRVT